MSGPDLYAWCEHGTPLGHTCQFCRYTAPAPPPAPAPPVPAGWRCGTCGHCYAPWIPECHHCPEPPAFTAKGNDPSPIEVGR